MREKTHLYVCTKKGKFHRKNNKHLCHLSATGHLQDQDIQAILKDVIPFAHSHLKHLKPGLLH